MIVLFVAMLLISSDVSVVVRASDRSAGLEQSDLISIQPE